MTPKKRPGPPSSGAQAATAWARTTTLGRGERLLEWCAEVGQRTDDQGCTGIVRTEEIGSTLPLPLPSPQPHDLERSCLLHSPEVIVVRCYQGAAVFLCRCSGKCIS